MENQFTSIHFLSALLFYPNVGLAYLNVLYLPVLYIQWPNPKEVCTEKDVTQNINTQP